ncbi:hypothetical protein Emed_002929 [Eimeria media]
MVSGGPLGMTRGAPPGGPPSIVGPLSVHPRVLWVLEWHLWLHEEGGLKGGGAPGGPPCCLVFYSIEFIVAMHTLYESEAPRGPPLAASLGAPLGLSGSWRPRSIPGGSREGRLQEGPPKGAPPTAAGEGQISAADIEVYAYQLEAAVAASHACRMSRQTTMLSELLQHNVALLRQHAITKHRHRSNSNSSSSSSSSSSSNNNSSSSSSSDSNELGSSSFLSPEAPPLLCPPPPAAATTTAAATAATATAAAAADGDTSWLFDFPPAAAAAPQTAGPPSQRSLWGRSLERGPLEAELQAAVGGPQGGLQWLHALSLIASDDQAAQSILEFAAADSGFANFQAFPVKA